MFIANLISELEKIRDYHGNYVNVKINANKEIVISRSEKKLVKENEPVISIISVND